MENTDENTNHPLLSGATAWARLPLWASKFSNVVQHATSAAGDLVDSLSDSGGDPGI
jgi:hypothetical protein